jgi:hypothetical protein
MLSPSGRVLMACSEVLALSTTCKTAWIPPPTTAPPPPPPTRQRAPCQHVLPCQVRGVQQHVGAQVLPGLGHKVAQVGGVPPPVVAVLVLYLQGSRWKMIEVVAPCSAKDMRCTRISCVPSSPSQPFRALTCTMTTGPPQSYISGASRGSSTSHQRST